MVRPYVLDDAADPVAHERAASLGLGYVVRPNRGEHKKSGNLRYAFAHTHSAFILILDADFAPRADFLAETLPYFDDPGIAIVQTPQYFRTDRRQNWVESAAGAIQELFYRAIQVGRDRLGASICVGSCAVYRREALEPQGGTTLIAYAEDVHTGLDVRRAGWNLAYVPLVLATGMCPSGLSAFLRQQYRWCTGSTSTVLTSRLWSVPMSLPARLTYVSGFCYYLFTAMSAFVIPLIPISLLLFRPASITPWNSGLIVASMLTSMTVLPLWHCSRYDLRATLPLSLVRAWAHALAIWDYLRGRTMSWQATGAGVSSVRRFWWGVRLYNLTAVLLWLGLIGWRMTVIAARPADHRDHLRPDQRGHRAAGDLPGKERGMIGRLRRRSPLLAGVISVIAALAVAGVTAALVEVALPGRGPSAAPVRAPSGPVVVRLPARPASYLGAYVSGSPASYAPMSSLANATGTRPDIALYYSGWGEPFQLTFAREAAQHGAIPLIQIEPTRVSLTAIAGGRYFAYLTRFADAVADYGRKTGRGVIIGFAHEPNGHWYPWGYRHVAAGDLDRGLAAGGPDLPRGGRGQRDLAVDGQHHRPAQRHPLADALVAGQRVRDLGRHRRLLPEAVLGVRAAVRTDHQGHPHADPGPDPDLRDRGDAVGQPAGPDRRPVRRCPVLRAARAGLVRLRQAPGLAGVRPGDGRGLPPRRAELHPEPGGGEAMTRRPHRAPDRRRSHARRPRPRRLLGSRRMRTWRIAAAMAAVLAVVAAAVVITLDGGFGGAPSAPARAYVGVFAPPAPASYAGVRAFTAATGVRPGLVAYYSAWNEPFRAGFARTAARHHALPSSRSTRRESAWPRSRTAATTPTCAPTPARCGPPGSGWCCRSATR